MVNVNKNIVSGNSAEKTEEKAPMRRPRNKALNSSKKVVDVRAASKGRQPVSVPLNSSKSLNSSLADQPLSLEMMTEMDKHLFPGYSDEEIERDMKRRYETAKENYPEYDEDTLMKQMLWDYFGIVDEWLPDIKDVTDVESMKSLSEDADLWADNPNFVDNVDKQNANSACSDKTDMDSSKELDSAEQQTSGNGWWEDGGSYFAKLDKDAIGDAMVNAVKYIDSRTDWDHMQGKVDMKDDEEYAFRYDRASVFVEDDSLPGTEVAPRNDDSIEKLQKGDFDNALCYVSVGENYCYALGKDVVGAIHQLATDPASIWYKVYPDDLKSKNAPEAGTEAEVDSSKKLNCAEDGEVKITTESGNEISLSDIQIIQNPETNEISLFIKEDEDEEIPEGFVVIATATQAALPAGDTCPNCGQEPCVCEGEDEGELDSSKKKKLNADVASEGEPVLIDEVDETYEYRGFNIYANPIKSTNPKRFYIELDWDNAGPFTLEEAARYIDSLREGTDKLDASKKKESENELNCSENIKEVLADAGDDEHDVLTYVIQCIEHLGKADEVLSAINDEAAPEGSNLREQLSDIDTHEALVAVVEALEDLGLVDEVLNTMAINPLGNEPDIDSNLNCSISEVTVPENFGREKSQLMDLRNIIEGELFDKGYEVAVKELARPNATTMQISFEGGNGYEDVIDRAIEEIVADVANCNSPTSTNSSLSEEEPIAEANQAYQVFYVDENGNEIDEPAVIEVPAGLTGIELYEAILDSFDEQYPNCSWETICDMEDNVKMDSSKKSELNSSVHDNPALKVFVDKIKQTAQQVSAVPTMEDGKTGYKIIVRGMESADVEPLAKEMGIKLAGIKPLEGGFAIIVDDVSLNNSTIDPESPDLMNDGMRYRGYFISGSDRIGYVCVSPYGAFSPGVYKTVDEAKEAIDQDMKFRFPEGEDLNSSIDTDKLYEIADRYSSSAPVSGNWDTETQHEMKAIMEELGVSEEEAKKLMINVLGFDESMLN